MKTGIIEEWGESPSNSQDSEIIEVMDDDLMPYVSIVCSVVNGELVVDENKLNEIKTAAQPIL